MHEYPLKLTEFWSRPEFCTSAADFLRVRSVSDLTAIFCPTLQDALDGCLENILSQLPSVLDAEPALFAAGDPQSSIFSRFCTADRLIELAQVGQSDSFGSLDLLLDHNVE